MPSLICAWDYRVICFAGEDETYYAIHEVYYDINKPVGYAANPTPIMWEDGIDGGARVLEHVSLALQKPVLTPKDFE